MSLYIPPECEQYLNVCTTEYVCGAYLFSGIIITLIVIGVLYLFFKK